MASRYACDMRQTGIVTFNFPLQLDVSWIDPALSNPNATCSDLYIPILLPDTKVALAQPPTFIITANWQANAQYGQAHAVVSFEENPSIQVTPASKPTRALHSVGMLTGTNACIAGWLRQFVHTFPV